MALKINGTKQGVVVEPGDLAACIAGVQHDSGEIPWSAGGKTDPWDHVEAAMGLAIGGRLEEARRAYRWLKATQLRDGSWYAYYRDGVPEDRTRDSNMSSYVAVGVYHHDLLTGDTDFLEEMWKTVSAGIEFALRLQAPTGEVYWARNPAGEVDPMALLTGSSSIYLSLKCALCIAERLGRSRPSWKRALARLGEAIRHRPSLFNMTKSRYSMDWFYPVLSGAVTGEAAQARIERYWNKFVVSNLGVRCVSDHPWITMAETSELCIALAAMGNRKLAEIVFNWILDRRYEDGSFWCGFTFPDLVIWPEERLTWTNGAVLLAADALYGLTPAGKLFLHQAWASEEMAGRLRETDEQDAALIGSDRPLEKQSRSYL